MDSITEKELKEDKKKIIESVNPGMANGISTQLYDLRQRLGMDAELPQTAKDRIIAEASIHFAKFLEALGVDYKNDPNSKDTPRRVAKAYVNDLWSGRFNPMPNITTFPTDGYDGMVFEGNIPVTSMCSHHHQTILGTCHIAYLPKHKLVGLSKLNRIVEYFCRRGSIQEQLTYAIHNALNNIIDDNEGVAVVVEAAHNCVSCRGVKHIGTVMKTSKLSGKFIEESEVREEFYNFVTACK